MNKSLIFPLLAATTLLWAGCASHKTDTAATAKKSCKDTAWFAKDANVTTYDTLYLPAVYASTNFDPDTGIFLAMDQAQFIHDLQSQVLKRHLFTNVVTDSAMIKTNAHVLMLANQVTEITLTHGAGYHFAWLYTAGQPTLRLEGTLTDGTNKLGSYDLYRRREDNSAKVQAVTANEDVQSQEVASLALKVAQLLADTVPVESKASAKTP